MRSMVARIWTITLAMSLLAFSAWLFVMSAQASALPAPAALDSAQQAQRDLAHAAIDKGQALFSRGSCLDPSRQNIVNLMIAALAQENPAKDYDRWSKLTMKLRGALQSDIVCDPSGSQDWSRLALLDLIESYDDVSARSHLEASFLLSPILYDDLTQRLAYWSRSEAWRSGRSGRLSGADIATLVRYAKQEDVAHWARLGVPAFQIAIREEIAKLIDPTRRSKIEALLIDAPLRGSVGVPAAPELQGDH